MGVKKNSVLSVSLNEELAKKFVFVCHSEGISTQNAISFLIRQKVSYFERVKGKIQPKDISDIVTEGSEETESNEPKL